MNDKQNPRNRREIANFGEAMPTPRTRTMRDVWDRLGQAQIRIPRFNSSSSTADDRPRPSADRRVVAELLALRGVAGDFVVPAGRDAWRPLLAYNRLRPTRVRVARAGLGLAIAERARPDRRRAPDADRAAGRPRAPRLPLDRARRAPPRVRRDRPSVPRVRDAGAAAVHRRRALRRLRQDRLGPGDPAHDRRRGRGAPTRAVPQRRTRSACPRSSGTGTGRASRSWSPRRCRPTSAGCRGAPASRWTRSPRSPPSTDRSRRRRSGRRTTSATPPRPASPRRPYGRRDVLHRAERIAADFGELDLTFGRWHGDWVPWNLGRVRRHAVRLGLGLQRDRRPARLRRVALHRHPRRGARAARAAPRRRPTPPR